MEWKWKYRGLSEELLSLSYVVKIVFSLSPRHNIPYNCVCSTLQKIQPAIDSFSENRRLSYTCSWLFIAKVFHVILILFDDTMLMFLQYTRLEWVLIIEISMNWKAMLFLFVLPVYSIFNQTVTGIQIYLKRCLKKISLSHVLRFMTCIWYIFISTFFSVPSKALSFHILKNSWWKSLYKRLITFSCVTLWWIDLSDRE